MTVKITESGEIEKLNITDPKTGLSWTNDLIGNTGALTDGQFVYDDDNDYYVCSQNTYDWWSDMIEKYETADYAKEEFLDNLSDDDVDENGYQKESVRQVAENGISDVCNCDLEDIPAAIMQFIADNK